MKIDRRRFLSTGVLLAGTAASRSYGAARALPSKRFTLSRQGCGRATGYAATNKIVTLGQQTHVAWLDSHDGRFLVRVRSLDRNSNTWSPTHTIGEAFDNHGGPELVADSRGYLHAVYYPHHHPFRYRRSLKPNDSSEWTPETSFGSRCTYTTVVVRPDDSLVLVCRERTDKRWVMNEYVKPVDGEWQGPRTLLHGNALSGYTRWQTSLALGATGEVTHMSFMVYEGSDLFGSQGPGYAVGYMRSRDGGRHWEQSGGNSVPLPATPNSIDLVEGARERFGPENLRPGNITVDPNGSPWIIYSRLDRQPFETWIARPAADGRWQKTSLLPAIRKRWPARAVKTPGQICFDRDGTMYVTVTTVHAGASVEQAYWGHQTAEVVLLVSRDLGRTFETFPLSPEDDDAPNWLPSLERPTRHVAIGPPSLMYTHGGAGSNNRQSMANNVVWCDLAPIINGADCQALELGGTKWERPHSSRLSKGGSTSTSRGGASPT